ncbi:MAG TPA: hypothetical protein VHB21_04085 [Minicystis sp.]|nr:hypothetical protein [Minicystis sp.]
MSPRTWAAIVFMVALLASGGPFACSIAFPVDGWAQGGAAGAGGSGGGGGAGASGGR